jgi:hypothetical protein
MTEWTKEKEKKILLRYRFTLTVRVVLILILCLFVFSVYKVIVTSTLMSLKLDHKHVYYTKVTTDWTIPNLREGFGGHMITDTTPFFTQKMSYPVVKRVGKEDKVVGEMNIGINYLGFDSQKNIQYFEKKQGNNYSFYLPEDPRTGEKLEAGGKPNVWAILEKVHEGTVAELSFSTSKFMTTEELLQLLKPYDVDVLWVPLYTGEFKTIKDVSYSSSTRLISLNNIFGLSGGREAGRDYMSEEKITVLFEENLSRSKQMMLTNMEYLLKNESKSYYENFLGLTHLQERYDYLKKNGFIVYGAVVTGPVKELLKLKDVQEIRGAQLGEMDYWNWE